ncbi:putative membrane protein [Cordyceps militaris]|uniref:Putative membrane protein n=1 Tax=Cordyceps militaris TaxID=73501 RepID=A0A2H4SKX4_CORMI|nr:putative membrane protein [Cordyceps militaris]
MASRISDFAPLKRAATRDSLEPWLKSVILAFGAAKILFFVPLLVLLPLRVPVPAPVAALVRWGPGGGGAEQYEEMIASIYVVWGVFMVRAAADPLRAALFLDFTACADTAHIGLMTLMAVVNAGDRVHLVGDVLAAWLFLGPFIYVWTAVRKERGPARPRSDRA